MTLSVLEAPAPMYSAPIQFLYPTARDFPFDAVCEEIVRGLEKRNWIVPGIEVKFDVYGSGDAKYRLVRDVRGENFALHFGRSQGSLNRRYNNTAAVTMLYMPMCELRVYEDHSGPTLDVYVGGDWKRDEKDFRTHIRVNSLLNHERRTYLRYQAGWVKPDSEGRDPGQHTYRGRIAPYLVHNSDLGREYSPAERCALIGGYDAPFYFETAKVFKKFTAFLEENVLALIEDTPVAAEQVDCFPEAEMIPWPEAIGPLFAFGEYRDEERIKIGKTDPAQLEDFDRCVFLGNGTRLVTLGTRGDFPKIAYEGFQWCGMGPVNAETPIESLEVPGYLRWSDRDRFVIRVVPNRANDIYIADHAPSEVLRRQLGEAIPEGRHEFTRAEMDMIARARARTLVPITEYEGGYEQPIVLIQRELGFDEVEIVSGPHKDAYGH